MVNLFRSEAGRTAAAASSGREMRDLLVAWRDDGDLPPLTVPALLARHVTTLTYGIAVHAAGGVGRDELQEMADAALRSWPPS
ncbi:hypothetical protein [Umezawaea beigongshangensis]|uniref:hypothetical protein n=1 Tax=Umezawaea beigongshangensis TaxID=2780383 RepID=UPI0018F13AAA|nr:hypothetical protein [Umezawaea beigongshangensis]